MVGNPRTETIDERIIRALNLDSEFEMSYEEYARHLKEAMIASRMTKSRYSSEEAILFNIEFKRVRSKKGRFIIKSKKVKITAAGLGLGGFTKPLKMAQKRLLLAPKQKVAGVGTEQDIFSKIDDLLASILSSVAEQNKETKKQTELQRKNSENRKRKQKELGLEKGKQALKNIVSTITKPFQSILDKIINFFVMTFLGRAVFKLLEWFSDPKNKEKINTITKFLKDWWPALVGGFVLFGTRFGKGIRVLTRIAISAIGKLGKASIALLRFAKNNPRVAQLATVGLYAGTQLAQRAFSGGEKEQGFWGGGFARKLFASGGRVSGPGGIDRVPAWLTNGEFVMSKGAVDKYGVSTLEAMNAAGGGTNVPTVGHGGIYAAGGGAIGKASDLITSEEALSSLSPGSNDYIVPNGRSVVSNLNWNKIKPDTLLHAYPDSRNVPTIGWGSTFYDKLTQGMKPVKIGDTITKRKADEILRSHVQQLSSLYSSKMPSWKNMSHDQKAAVLSIGYNAGAYAPLGTYPKLSMALKVGDMPAAAKNVVRSGPSAERLKVEQKLLLSGPKDTSKAAPKPQPIAPNFIQKAKTAIGSLIRPRAKAQPSVVNMSAGQGKGTSKNRSTAQEPPMSFNAVHPKGTRIAEAVYGVRK